MKAQIDIQYTKQDIGNYKEVHAKLLYKNDLFFQ